MSRKLRVLVACEFSGAVRNAFTALGHSAASCDLIPSLTKGEHYQCDVREILEYGWDLMIAHPPCTFLTASGNRWMSDKVNYPNRERDRRDAIKLVRQLWDAPIRHIAIENPIGVLSTSFIKPQQIIQPYEFGNPERKATCLWLKHLPKLKPTKIVEPHIITHPNGKTDSYFHYSTFRLPKDIRSTERSKTFKGIALAMAKQWGSAIK